MLNTSHVARFGQVLLVTLYDDKAVLDMRTVQKIRFFPTLKYNLFDILKAAKKSPNGIPAPSQAMNAKIRRGDVIMSCS